MGNFRTCKCKAIYCKHYPEPHEGRAWYAFALPLIPWAVVLFLLFSWTRALH